MIVHQGLLNNKIFKSQGLSCIVTDIPDGYTRKSLILALKCRIYLLVVGLFLPNVYIILSWKEQRLGLIQ